MKFKKMSFSGSLNTLFFCAGLSLPSLPLLANVETTSDNSTPAPLSSSTENPDNRNLCADETNLICGVHYVEKQLEPSCKMLQRFEYREKSESEEYNLSTFMNGFGKHYRDFCVDHNILNNEKAGYSLDQLEGVTLSGALKVQQLASGRISYIPFRTTPLKKRDSDNSKQAVYKFQLLEDRKPITLFTDRSLGLEVRSWLAESAAISKADIPLHEKINLVSSLGNAELRKISKQWLFNPPTLLIKHYPHTNDLASLSPFTKDIAPSVKMTLTRSEWFSGKTYDIHLQSFLEFPSENMRVDFISGGTARLAAMDHKNFRQDLRYTRSVSLVPSTKSIKRSHHINVGEKLIEIILVPPSYPPEYD